MNAPQAPANLEPLLLEQRSPDGVVTLTLNRPAQFNSLSEEMLAALQAAFDRIGADRTARVIVVAAAGKAFCAGHDLKQMKANPRQDYYEKLFADCAGLMLTISRVPQPVIARVHGIATAAGCQLVAMCDLAVAAEEAKFAVSGVNLGLFCSTPSVPLSRNVPRKTAFEMLVTGEFIDAVPGGAVRQRHEDQDAEERERQQEGQNLLRATKLDAVLRWHHDEFLAASALRSFGCKVRVAAWDRRMC